MPSLADLIERGDFARGLNTPSSNPFGQWAQGVAQRTMHPLETLAGAAQQSLSDPTETALNWSSPMAGVIGSVGGKLSLKSLLKKTPTKTEFELAHEVAQRNAALPIEQGGLGLPPNNTAMDRAKAMGFKSARDLNTESQGEYWLHGSPSGDIKEFSFGGGSRNLTDNNSVGVAFTTNAPGEADFYAKGGEYGGSAIQSIERGESPTIYPLMISGKYRINPGKNYVGDNNVANFTTRGSEKEWAVPAQSSQIRSRFAAFDPMQRNSANILAGGAAGAIGISSLADLLNQDEYQ